MNYLDKAMEILSPKEKAPATEMTGTPKTCSNSTIKTRRGTANDAIKQAFKRGEWLTDAVAFTKYGCKRFKSLMTELRQRGWLFFDEWVSGLNRYGNHSRWKRYRLLKAGY